MVDILSLRSESVDPLIFADPDPRSQNVTDPTDLDLKQCFLSWFRHRLWCTQNNQQYLGKLSLIRVLFSLITDWRWYRNDRWSLMVDCHSDMTDDCSNMIHVYWDVTVLMFSLKRPRKQRVTLTSLCWKRTRVF